MSAFLYIALKQNYNKYISNKYQMQTSQLHMYVVR